MTVSSYISSFIQQPGILGVGYGAKEVKGQITTCLSWRFYVRIKRPLSLVSINQRIPAYIEGIPTDVIEMAETIKSAYQLPMIANSAGVPGTIGCIAWSLTQKENVLLTNYHVLFANGASTNQKVWLVQSIDDKQKFIDIGTALYGKYDIVDFTNSSCFIDAGIASINKKEKQQFDANSSYRIRYPGTSKAVVGEQIYKWGAASGYTRGIVVDIQYPDVVKIREQICNAPNQILIKPISDKNRGDSSQFSASGDSGSVIVNAENKIIGLLWGYNQRGEGIACPIEPVLQELSLQIPIPPKWKKILKAIVHSF